MSQKEILPVVKADAYGHGMVPISRALVYRGNCRMLAVATLEEGLELRKNFPPTVGILVLSGFFPHQTPAYVKYRLTPMVHTIYQLIQMIGMETLPEVHLKVDSGMNRLGISPAEIPEAMRILAKLNIKLSGLATHFAESEALSSNFIDTQIREFQDIHREFRSARLLQTDARVHVSNTGAILRQKLGMAVAVRPGLGLYGVTPNPRIASSEMLTPILQWKTRVLALKNLKKGDTVGYGRTYTAKKKEKLAILPIGYADGYPRSLGNKGHVLLGGKVVPIRGRVSMDLIAVDATSVTGLREGGQAILIGRHGKQEISAWDLANACGTIPYEIFCGLSARVPRVYLD